MSTSEATTMLSNYTESRNNNFNLIRFLAASLVILSHSYPLLGLGSHEPLKSITGVSLGGLAVDVFFISSGFLICRSFVRRPSILDFSASRILRIYPALIVAVLFCTLVVGVIYTSLPVVDYLTKNETYLYLAKNSILILGVHHTLPGVFETLPFSGAVNGSLWTLPYEITMYAAIVLTLLLSNALLRKFRVKTSWTVLIATLVIASKYFFDHYNQGASTHIVSLSLMFFSGSSYYIFQNKINMNTKIFIIILLILAVSCSEKSLFLIVYPIALPYIILYLAYIPGGTLLKFNRYGDYSYGIYIYAFPIQQILVYHLGDSSPLALSILAFPLTFVLAFLSWHVIEKRALSLKHRIIKFERLKN